MCVALLNMFALISYKLSYFLGDVRRQLYTVALWLVWVTVFLLCWVKNIVDDLCARPSSGFHRLTTTVYKPKPRYAKPEVTSSTFSTSALNFESTDQIREAAFREWLAKRKGQFHRWKSELTVKEKELEEQKAKVYVQKLFSL